MKTLPTMTISLLLLVIAAATPTSAESASVLLQEGLYAEEIEGDLDKAIKIYQQVVEEASEIQRLAAKATYQLGMCYLKKGDKTKAAEYFQQIVSNYPTQKILAKKANRQLEKVSSVEDIIAKSYVIHYRAVDQSKNALELLNRNHPKGVRTHHANRYRKNDITINSICTDTRKEKEKIVAVIEGSDELKLVKVVPPIKQAKVKSIFEQIDYQVTRFLGDQFGKTALKAGQQHLSVNSHIYYVDLNGFYYRGGMNAFYNWTGRTITQKVSFGGTSYPNQTHYGIDGRELNTEIVPDKTRPNHWQIYWIPDEPLAPEEHLYYGWSMNDKRKLPQLPGGVYSLMMQNKYGSPVIETFFLVLPKELKISQSNHPTGSQELLDFDVYWWTKTVQQNKNHVERVQLDKLPASSTEAIMTQEMHNTIDANGLIHFKSPNRISNNNSEPMKTTGFVNSDFVTLTTMYEENGAAIPFETTHEGNIYRYRITFNKPIMQGESMVYYTEGTTRGLIRPVPGSKDVFRYFMVHSPRAGQPVLRIETYLLPEDAVFISTSTPDIRKTEKDGRIELRVEKVVPANGSITTEFQYKLSASSEPLKLEPAPWVDGEVMEVRLKRPAGNEYGTIIYSAQRNILNEKETWRVMSHMHVTTGNIQQYTLVEAELNSFAPLLGRTKNWMGDYIAEYGRNKVNLKMDVGGKQTSREIAVEGIAYDNEQALYLIRRMPLAEDYEGSFPIFSVQGGATIECRIKVLGIEEVTVEAGTFRCYKTDLSIYMGEVRTLQHTLWFSADEHKYLVKYDVGGAATMKLATVRQKDKNKPLTFEDTDLDFSVTIPTDWRFYRHKQGDTHLLQLIAPELKAWSVFACKEMKDNSAKEVAEKDVKKLEGQFDNYIVRSGSWSEIQITGLDTARYLADYQKSGTGLVKFQKPIEMVEYRTYIVGKSMAYWFVFRIEKDKFEENKTEFDSIVKSFKANAK